MLLSFNNNNIPIIYNAIKEEGTHTTISNVAKTLLKDSIVYDESCDLWFYCNNKNIRKKSKTAFIFKGLLST